MGAVSVFLASLAAIAKLVLLSAVGVAAAFKPVARPLLAPAIISSSARLSQLIFTPALLFSSLAASLSAPLLGELWWLPVSSIAVTALSGMLFWPLRYLLPCFQDPVTDAPHLRAQTAQPQDGEDGTRRDVSKALASGRLLHTLLTIAVMAPNAVALPLVVMQSLCEESIVNSEFDGDAVDCFEQGGSTYIFLYAIGWSFSFWSSLFPVLQNLVTDAAAGGAATPSTAATNGEEGGQSARLSPHPPPLLSSEGLKLRLRSLWGILTEVNMVSNILGVCFGLIPPLQRMLFHEPSVLRPVGSTLQTLGDPVVALNTLLISASLAQVHIPWLSRLLRRVDLYINARSGSQSGSAQRSSSSSLSSSAPAPAPAATLALQGIANLPPRGATAVLQSDGKAGEEEENMESNGAVALPGPHLPSPPSVADSDDPTGLELTTYHCTGQDGGIVLGGESEGGRGGGEFAGADGVTALPPVPLKPMVKPLRLNDRSCSRRIVECEREESELIPTSAVAAFVLCRLVIVPAAMLAVVWLMEGALPNNRLLKIIIALEAAMPSAQILIVSLNRLGAQKMAGQLAAAYLIQYLTCLLTLTGWSTIVLSMFE